MSKQKTVKWKAFLRFLLFYPVYLYRFIANSLYDVRRFWRYSTCSERLDRKEQLQSWIDGDCHKIEKALALPKPRPGFGQPVVWRLIRNLKDYLEKFGEDHSVQRAICGLQSYRQFNERADVRLESLFQSISELGKQSAIRRNHSDATQEVSREWIHRQGKMDLEAFFCSRYSIRQFSDLPVSMDLIERAVFLAQKTPTVCNRQAVKVYAYVNEEEKNQVLSCQGGNAGFGHTVKAVLIVTADTSRFFSVGERNQCWIDGGLFSMSLVYALHSLGLGSCCLNWSVEKGTDQKLRRITGIPESEAVIMMIGVGHLPEKLVVARSMRKPLDTILVKGHIESH
jgi:nitroreductase